MLIFNFDLLRSILSIYDTYPDVANAGSVELCHRPGAGARTNELSHHGIVMYTFSSDDTFMLMFILHIGALYILTHGE